MWLKVESVFAKLAKDELCWNLYCAILAKWEPRLPELSSLHALGLAEAPGGFAQGLAGRVPHQQPFSFLAPERESAVAAAFCRSPGGHRWQLGPPSAPPPPGPGVYLSPAASR